MQNKLQDTISKKIAGLPMQELALQTNFQIREDAKIDAHSFVAGFFVMMHQGVNTLKTWASNLALFLGHDTLSAQGLVKKLQFRHIDFTEQLLNKVLSTKAAKHQKQIAGQGLLKSFGRVFLEDSTCFALPSFLYDFFRGTCNRYGKSSTARVQLRMELLSGAYHKIDLQSFRDNDQKYAGDICKTLRKDDLVIRDMGYSVLHVFKQIKACKAFFLSRLRFGASIYKTTTGEQLDLDTLLNQAKKQNRHTLDIAVKVGKKEQVNLRLIAIRVPQQVEQSRRRKAIKNRNAKANHNQAYLDRLAWTLLITNVEQQVWTPKQALQVYSWRWYIEIIFKAWKSELKMQKCFEAKQSISPPRVIMTFFLMLTWVSLMLMPMFYLALSIIWEKHSRGISILKFASLFRNHADRMDDPLILEQYADWIFQHCKYDKRKNSSGMIENIYMLI